MTEMMPAVLLDEQRRYVFGQRPVPEPGPDQVLVGVDLCGICGSDLHAADLPQVYRGGFVLLDTETTPQLEATKTMTRMNSANPPPEESKTAVKPTFL